MNKVWIVGSIVSLMALNGALMAQGEVNQQKEPATKAADHKTQPKVAPGHNNKKETCTCPMHGEMATDKPCKCPRCGMSVVKKEMKKKEVVKTTYYCPMHPEVVAESPGKCTKCGMNLVKKVNKPIRS